jgi:hypothetical protein
MRAQPDERYASTADLLSDLRAVVQESQGGGRVTTPSRDAVAPPPGRALWWWQFHQGAIAALNTAMPLAAFLIRKWPPAPYGTWIFFAVLALATISVTLRLNLIFASRIHPDTLGPHRRRLFPAIAAADALLAGVLLVAAAAIAGAHDEMAALLLVAAIVLLASLSLVEPATTRAAFRDS